MAADFGQQYAEVGVAHRRLRRQTDNFSKTLLRLFIVAELAIRETFEVVERRVARTAGDGAIDHRKRLLILTVLQESERLLEGRLNTGSLSRGITRQSDDD